jgi:heat shock protein HslJ
VPAADAFPARGNEPGWVLALEGGDFLLRWNYGEQQAKLPMVAGEAADQGVRYTTGDDAHQMLVEVRPGPCNDDMSGMPHPYFVAVTIDGQSLRGCGGDPAALLQGGTWTVSALDGEPPLPDSSLTMTFGTDGVVHGDAGCNRFQGQYQLSGEGLSLGPLAATRKACEPPLMDQEMALMMLLEGVGRFDVTENGEVLLHGAEGDLRLAR